MTLRAPIAFLRTAPSRSTVRNFWTYEGFQFQVILARDPKERLGLLEFATLQFAAAPFRDQRCPTDVNDPKRRANDGHALKSNSDGGLDVGTKRRTL